MQKTLALCVNWASGLCANHLGCDACTAAVLERSRNGLGTVSERVRRRAHWHGRAKVSQGLNCVAGAALSPWQAQHFRKVKYRFRGRRSTFARCCVHSLRAGGWQDAENVGAVRDLGFRTVRKPPRLRRLYGPIGTAARRFRKV